MSIRNYFVIASLLLSLACTQEKEEASHLMLTNLSTIPLTEKSVRIARQYFKETRGSGALPLLDSGHDTLPMQVNDLDGDGQWDELFVVTDFEPNETKKITVHWVDSLPDFPIRTGVRFGKRDAGNEPVTARTDETFVADELPKSLGYQPYQTDGPSWENDKVGFRHYLDGRNAKDLFGKKNGSHFT